MVTRFPNKMYRNISLVFIAVTALMIVGVIMFFYSQAVVVVTASSQELDLNFEAQIKTTPTADELENRDIISGTLVRREYVASTTVAVASTKTVVSDIVGTVTLINDSPRDQPLVRTTQLADAAGTVVRTDASVVVPAGDKVTVAVYPRDPDEFSTVASGKLTIIKLAPSLQPVIYGEVTTALTAEPRELKVITESELNRARQELMDKVVADIRKELALPPTTPVAVELGKYGDRRTENRRLRGHLCLSRHGEGDGDRGRPGTTPASFGAQDHGGGAAGACR